MLDDFIRLDADPERWDDPSFAPVLGGFQRRFSQTNTEEGTVMATVLAYAMDQAYASSRRTLLSAFRRSEEVRQLITRGVLELDAVTASAQTLELEPSLMLVATKLPRRQYPSRGG